jgi:hypothetical protein
MGLDSESDVIAICKIDGGAAFGKRALAISCMKLARLITHERTVGFSRCICESHSPQ